LRRREIPAAAHGVGLLGAKDEQYGDCGQSKLAHDLSSFVLKVFRHGQALSPEGYRHSYQDMGSEGSGFNCYQFSYAER
jgi:hypothetical protein